MALLARWWSDSAQPDSRVPVAAPISETLRLGRQCRAPSAPAVLEGEFVAASKYQGPRDGYVFGTRDVGLGYHRDRSFGSSVPASGTAEDPDLRYLWLPGASWPTDVAGGTTHAPVGGLVLTLEQLVPRGGEAAEWQPGQRRCQRHRARIR